MIDVQVKSVRSRGRYGGAIISGRIVNSGEMRVIILNHAVLPDSESIYKGQVWRVSGKLESRDITPPFGNPIAELTILADSASLLHPSGENIIDYIANNPDIVGVGYVKASKLYGRFGTELLQIIEGKDVRSLQEVVSAESADAICKAFEQLNVARSLLFLDSVGIPQSIGRKVIDVYGADTQRQITEDPYRLLSFCGKWEVVDRFAISKCGIQLDEDLRLQAAVEEALYRCFDNGSTAADEAKLKRVLISLLGSAELAHEALSLGSTNGQYYRTELYHPAGAWLMERYIAERISAINKYHDGGQLGLIPDEASIEDVVALFETTENIELTDDQRKAVVTSALNRFSLILGGAGVGKTTVLKCVYAAMKSLDPFWVVYQLALSGKAAKRMTESTHLDSYTIEGFLRNVKREEIPDNAWIVVDEASMVDVVSFYRLLRHIPNSARLILIGDPYQLPPVGPGLVLHVLVNSAAPQTTLTVVKRQSEESGIPQVAAAIRAGKWPSLPTYRDGLEQGVSFALCDESHIEETVAEIYKQIGGDGSSHEIKILSPTRSGFGGVQSINAALQMYFRNGAPSISYVDEEFGVVDYWSNATKLKVGDLVMFTRNDYERDLRNGSLGVITERLIPGAHDDPVCVADFEGQEVMLDSSDLDAVDLAYAITVHKSQGSQFKRVIVPVRKSRLLDLTLLYTAITRGVCQVVLVGDMAAARAALKRISANLRIVGLPIFMS